MPSTRPPASGVGTDGVPEETQRRIYADTAHQYDRKHGAAPDEHALALRFLISAIDLLQAKSVLDVGAGTGRVILQISAIHSDLDLLGIEPVSELREVAYRKGVPRHRIVDGNALRLPFSERSFDVVCAFGVLHHIRTPNVAVAEMLRVARKAVFLSDSNNFGQGSVMLRTLKQLIQTCGLWRAANFIKTKGRGYTISEGDGLSYSYSLFNNYWQIRHACHKVHLLNTSDAGVSLFRTASHMALLGIKK